MRTIISSVALSSLLLAQSAIVAFADSKGKSSTQFTTAVTCQEYTIGRNGIQVNWQGDSEWPVTLTAFDFIDAVGHPITHWGVNTPSFIPNSGGAGNISPASQGEYNDNRKFEFARRNDRSEKLRVDFGEGAAGINLTKATVTVSRFYVDGGRLKERGQWVAYDEGMNVVPPSVVGSDLFYGVQNSGSGPGIRTFTVQTNTPFRYLEFIPLQSVSPTNNNILINSAVDNSDFMVRQIVIEECPTRNEQPCPVTATTLPQWNLAATVTGVTFDGVIVNAVGSPQGLAFLPSLTLGGWGVNSQNTADNGPFKPEIGWRKINGVGKSEILWVNVFDENEYRAADVKLTRFYREFGAIERGHYQLYDADGNEIPEAQGGYGTFFGLQANNGINPGELSLAINSDVPFRKIKFTAGQWIDQVLMTPKETFNGDNSDYHVQEITLYCERLPNQPCPECDTRVGGGLEESWAGVTFRALDFNGNPATVNYPTDATWRPGSAGVGIVSPVSTGEVPNPQGLEIGYRNGKTEKLRVDFGDCNDFTVADVTLARFYIENGLTERGKWTAYGPTGAFIVDGEFSSFEPITDGLAGLKTFSISTPSRFRYIEFEVLPNKNGAGTAITTGSDNSDYLVQSISVRCPRTPNTCRDDNPSGIIAEGRPDDETLWSDIVNLSAEQFGTVVTPGAAIAPYFLSDAAGASWRAASGGVGVLSVDANETSATAKFEIGFRNQKREKLTLDFISKTQPFKKIIIKLSRFYVEGYRETANYRVFDRFGNFLKSDGFTATQNLSTPGYYDLVIDCEGPEFVDRAIGTIELTASLGLGLNMSIVNEVDNSDFLVRQFVIPCPTQQGGGVAFNPAQIAGPAFVVYPNPAVDQINVAMESANEGVVTYAVRDLTGKVIKEASWNVVAGSNSTSISVADLNNGMYIMTVKNGSEVKNTKFMIKR